MMNKKTTANILSVVGISAGILGVYYAKKKGYGSLGKFGMFLLFAAPFTIGSVVILSGNKEEDINCPDGMITCADGSCDIMTSSRPPCQDRGGVKNTIVY